MSRLPNQKGQSLIQGRTSWGECRRRLALKLLALLCCGPGSNLRRGAFICLKCLGTSSQRHPIAIFIFMFITTGKDIDFQKDSTVWVNWAVQDTETDIETCDLSVSKCVIRGQVCYYRSPQSTITFVTVMSAITVPNTCFQQLLHKSVSPPLFVMRSQSSNIHTPFLCHELSVCISGKGIRFTSA